MRLVEYYTEYTSLCLHLHLHLHLFTCSHCAALVGRRRVRAVVRAGAAARARASQRARAPLSGRQLSRRLRTTADRRWSSGCGCGFCGRRRLRARLGLLRERYRCLRRRRRQVSSFSGAHKDFLLRALVRNLHTKQKINRNHSNT